MQDTASQSGVNLRRFTARGEIRRELYVEVPFDLSLDGTYFTVLDYFGRLSRAGRVVNVGNLRINPVGSCGGGKYTITPNETVVVTCTATTFYQPQSPPRRVSRGQRVMPNTRLMTLALIVVFGVALAALAQNPQTRGLGQAAKAKTPGAGATKSKAPATASQAKGLAAPASKRPASESGDRRDPFVSTIKLDKTGQLPIHDCPPGVRGILVGQAELDGVVQTPADMIAVITTSNTGRTYFLREGTTLCNGRVLQITPDSIVFEESVLDLSGKLEKREVIKKIPAEAI